jgi:RHS repeat-associated protein
MDIQSTASQTISSTIHRDAFGNQTSINGAWTGPFGYAGGFGYQQDADSGLMLLGHRYYDPSTGRFLTRDPIKDGRNWYSYGGGDGAPTGFVDPIGLMDTPPLWQYLLETIAGELSGPGGGLGLTLGSGGEALGSGLIHIGGWRNRIEDVLNGGDRGLTTPASEMWGAPGQNTNGGTHGWGPPSVGPPSGGGHGGRNDGPVGPPPQKPRVIIVPAREVHFIVG